MAHSLANSVDRMEYDLIIVIFRLIQIGKATMPSESENNRHHRHQNKKIEYPADFYGIFHHKEYHEVIDMVYSNIKYSYSVAFYENLTENCLRNLLATVFHNKDANMPKHHKKNVAKMIIVLKSNLKLLDYIEGNKKFNKKLIFGFLFCEPVPEVAVDIFSQIFLTYAKYAPNQTLKLFKDVEIQETYFANLNFAPLYRILYTTIFCLDQLSTASHPKFIPKCLHALLGLIFKDSSGLSIFGNEDESFQKYLIQCEQNSQKTTGEGEMAHHKIPQPVSEKSLLQITQSKEHADQKSKRHYNYFCTKNTKHQIFNAKIKPQFLSKMTENVTLVTQMLQQVFRSIPDIYQNNLITLLTIMQEHNYVQKIFMCLRIIRQSDFDPLDKNQCFYEIFRLLNMILLGWEIIEDIMQEQFQKVGSNHYPQNFKHVRSSIDSIQSQRQMMEKSQSSHSRDSPAESLVLKLPALPEDVYLYRNLDKSYDVGQMTENQLTEYNKNRYDYNQEINARLIELSIVLIQQFHYFEIYEAEFFQQKKKRLKQSMNSKIEVVTLSQYEQIKLTLTVLEFLQANNYVKISEEFCQKIKELTKLSTQGIIEKVSRLLKISKWNNILQAKIVHLIKKYVFLFYKEFIKQIMSEQDASKGFLGLLLQLFRNSVFMFLESGKRASFGDRHAIYTLSKIITNEFVAHGDIKKIYERFPLWKEFVQKDLTKYHEEHIFQLCSDEEHKKIPNLCRHKSLQLSDQPFQISIGNGDEAEQFARDYQKNRREKRASIDEKLLLFGEKKTLEENGEGFQMKNTRKIADQMFSLSSLRDFSLYYRALKQSSGSIF